MGVTGITTLTGALNANGGITCDSNKFTVADNTGDTAIAGTLTVTGDNATTLGGSLGVTGITTLTGALNANGATTIANTLTVTGTNATTLTGALNANGGIAISTSTAISGGSTAVGTSSLSVYGLRVGSGNVGIGTASPTQALDVNGSLRVNTNNTVPINKLLVLWDGTNTTEPVASATSFIGFGANTSMLRYQVDATTTRHAFYASTTELMTILGNGNVGIGKTSPTVKLDVNGQINATTFNATSDYRIKSNIVPLSDTEFKVDLLRPVFYFNKLIKKNDIGFIAHEVSEHFPFLVSRNKDDEEYQSLNYIGIIGLLTNEIIEIKKRNKIIDEELIEIKNKINEMI